MIRDASECDLDSIAEGMVRVQHLHADAYPSIYRRSTHAEAVAQLLTELATPDVAVRVACDSTQIIGHYILAIESTPECMFKYAQRLGHLRQIEVDPYCRRNGVGLQLLDDAIEISEKLELDRVVLDVWAFNTAARSLFDSVGFTELGSKLVRFLNEPDADG